MSIVKCDACGKEMGDMSSEGGLLSLQVAWDKNLTYGHHATPLQAVQQRVLCHACGVALTEQARAVIGAFLGNLGERVSGR